VFHFDTPVNHISDAVTYIFCPVNHVCKAVFYGPGAGACFIPSRSASVFIPKQTNTISSCGVTAHPAAARHPDAG
jgi:hypothetical protein